MGKPKKFKTPSGADGVLKWIIKGFVKQYRGNDLSLRLHYKLKKSPFSQKLREKNLYMREKELYLHEMELCLIKASNSLSFL